MIQLELKKPLETFVVFRTTINLTAKEVERIATQLETILSQRLVHFVVKQHEEDSSDVVVYIAPLTRMDRIMKKLDDRDYDKGPEPSETFGLKEGDLIDITFRGNIQRFFKEPEDDEEVVQDERLLRMFNTNMENKFHLNLRENNVFVQRSYEVYRGFVQLNLLTEAPPEPEAKKQDGKLAPVAVEASVAAAAATKLADSDASCDEAQKRIEYKRTLLQELLITFPKSEDLISAKALQKAQITYLDERDLLNNEGITKLSQAFGPEMTQMAKSLGVSRVKVLQLIRNNHLEKSEADLNFNLIMAWIKTLPRSADKIELFNQALKDNGRSDLSKYIETLHTREK